MAGPPLLVGRKTQDPTSRWRIVLAAFVLFTLTAFAAYYAVSETRLALGHGYIDVGVKRSKNSSEWLWQARHDRDSSPTKFYIHLLRPVALFLMLASACTAALVRTVVRFTGGPFSQPSGSLRIAHRLSLGVAALSGLYWVFLLFPLK
jgi:hypothetical protein